MLLTRSAVPLDFDYIASHPASYNLSMTTKTIIPTHTIQEKDEGKGTSPNYAQVQKPNLGLCKVNYTIYKR